MKRQQAWFNFCSIIFLLIFSRFLEVFIKHSYFPQTNTSANILTKHFGFMFDGVWGYFLVLVYAFIIFCAAYDVFGKAEYPDEKGLSFSNFLARYYLDSRESSSLLGTFFAKPKNIFMGLKDLGYSLPRFFIINSVLSMISCPFRQRYTSYDKFCATIFRDYWIIPALLLFGVLYFLFFRREYKHYQQYQLD
jgi:hypothetical protein